MYQIGGCYLGQYVLGFLFGRFSIFLFGAEANHLAAEAAFDDFFQAGEGSADNEENLGGIDLYVLLFWVFTTALRGDVGYGAFQKLQQGLLDTFAGNITGNTNILIGFTDFIDFIDINNTPLGSFNIKFGVLEESKNDILDILTNVEPASVKVVASLMAKGTFRKRAKVRANRVLPQPVGPMSRTLLFSISTSPSELSACASRL